MKLLNDEFQIYSANVSELRFGEIRSFHNFDDNEPLSSLQAYYDKESDRFVINEEHVKELYEFCRLGFARPLEKLKKKLPEFRTRIELVKLIINVRTTREEKVICKQKEEAINPNTKFVSIGDDIFQISKLVSVKCSNEAERAFIEVFVTNKRASIKNHFPVKLFEMLSLLELRKCWNYQRKGEEYE